MSKCDSHLNCFKHTGSIARHQSHRSYSLHRCPLTSHTYCPTVFAGIQNEHPILLKLNRRMRTPRPNPCIPEPTNEHLVLSSQALREREISTFPTAFHSSLLNHSKPCPPAASRLLGCCLRITKIDTQEVDLSWPSAQGSLSPPPSTYAALEGVVIPLAKMRDPDTSMMSSCHQTM